MHLYCCSEQIYDSTQCSVQRLRSLHQTNDESCYTCINRRQKAWSGSDRGVTPSALALAMCHGVMCQREKEGRDGLREKDYCCVYIV